MNILIVGYGRMGREIETVCAERGHAVTAKVDPVAEGADARSVTADLFENVDAAIEFSLAGGVLSNAELYADAGIAAVVGTTGWTDKRPQVENLFAEKGAYLWGSNFSIGAHVFFMIAETAAELISDIPEYDIMAYEIHHAQKADSPSGTALSLAERILDANKRKTKIVTEKLDRKIEADELHVASVRGGSVPGIHTVMIDSSADSVELKHTARNRGGFALGAVMAAEWLYGKKGFFQVSDFITELFSRGSGGQDGM